MTNDECSMTRDLSTVRMTFDVPAGVVEDLVNVHQLLCDRAGQGVSVRDCMMTLWYLKDCLQWFDEPDFCSEGEREFWEWLKTLGRCGLENLPGLVPIREVGLPVRIGNVLYRAGYKNLAEVLDVLGRVGGEEKLLCVRNFSSGSLGELKRFLVKKGWSAEFLGDGS